MANETVPAEQPEGAAAEQPDQANPDTMPLEDLAALIQSEGLPHEEIAPEVQTSEPEPEVTPQPEPEPSARTEPEPTESELRDAQAKLEREQWQARYEKLEQHAGRLAGELGYLKRQLGDRTRDAEAELPSGDGGTTELSERFDAFERRVNQEAANRAIAEELQAISGRSEFAALKLQEEINEAAKKHVDRWQQVLSIEEPEQARLAARELGSSILMDAIGLRLQKKPQAPATNESRVVDRKTAISASGATGARAAARPKPPDPKTMPLEDLRAWIDQLSGE